MDLIIILSPQSECFHPLHRHFDFARDNSVTVLMPWRKFEQNMLNVLPFDCTDEHKTLFRVPASEETRAVDLLIYLLYAAATQI